MTRCIRKFYPQERPSFAASPLSWRGNVLPVSHPVHFTRLVSGLTSRHALPVGGIGFTDERSGLRFDAYLPSEVPDLWRVYLDGAEERYRAHGVEKVLAREKIEDGASTALFWVVTNEVGDVVGGCRVQGPLEYAFEASAMWELGTSSQLDVVEGLLSERIPSGVVEVKAGWLVPRYAGDQGASDALARTYVHSNFLLNCRYTVGTASDHVLVRWGTSGARPVPNFVPVPYPDDRYRTVMIWWDREALPEQASPSQLAKIRQEEGALAGRLQWAMAV